MAAEQAAILEPAVITTIDLQKNALDKAAHAALDLEKHYRTFLHSMNRSSEDNPTLYQVVSIWLTVTELRDALEKGELE